MATTIEPSKEIVKTETITVLTSSSVGTGPTTTTTSTIQTIQPSSGIDNDRPSNEMTLPLSESQSSSIITSQQEPPKIAPYFAVGPESRQIICPFCNEKVQTELHMKNYYYMTAFDCLTCLSCCYPIFWLLCLLTPICAVVRSNYHYCPKCKACLGKFRRP